jgi:hypothetical protein
MQDHILRTRLLIPLPVPRSSIYHANHMTYRLCQWQTDERHYYWCKTVTVDMSVISISIRENGDINLCRKWGERIVKRMLKTKLSSGMWRSVLWQNVTIGLQEGDYTTIHKTAILIVTTVIALNVENMGTCIKALKIITQIRRNRLIDANLTYTGRLWCDFRLGNWFFKLRNPSNRTVALGAYSISNRNGYKLPPRGDIARSAHKADNLTATCELIAWNNLGSSTSQKPIGPYCLLPW